MTRGCDISHWNGKIDFKKLKENLDFVIIKAGGSDGKKTKPFYTDVNFYKYYADAKNAGFSVGCYYFVGSKCISKEDGIADAKRFINIIKGLKFEMPVFIDLESTPPAYKNGATQAVIGFCDTMEKAGYYVGVYASDISGFKDRLNLNELENYDKWVARYGSKPQYVKNYGVWQYTSEGQVNGVKTKLDLDIAFKDYAQIMIKTHLNGF